MVLKGINQLFEQEAVTYGRHRTRSAGMETSGAGLKVKAGARVVFVRSSRGELV